MTDNPVTPKTPRLSSNSNNSNDSDSEKDKSKPRRTRDSLGKITNDYTDIPDELNDLMERLETESVRRRQSIRGKYQTPAPPSPTLPPEQPQSETQYMRHKPSPTPIPHRAMMARQPAFVGGMGYPSGQQLPILKEVKDWERWHRALKGIAKMENMYGLLNGRWTKPQEGEYQDIPAFEEAEDLYQAALNRLDGLISVSLGTGAAAHVAHAEGPIEMIDKLQSVYREKSFTKREELTQVVFDSDESNKPMLERVETIKKARNGLIEMGYPIPDWLISSCFLHSLPKRFETWIDMQYNNRTKELDMDGEELEFDKIADELVEKEK